MHAVIIPQISDSGMLVLNAWLKIKQWKYFGFHLKEYPHLSYFLIHNEEGI